jgi:hypothetical protein
MHVGDTLTVLVKKEIELNGERFFVLEAEGSKNIFLLPAKQYVFYNIKPNMHIQVKIDKINCSGEIFLEPLHPFYEEGKAYWFHLVNYQKIDDHTLLEVKDVFGNPVQILTKKNPPIQADQVWLWVKGIKKGIPILCVSNEELHKYQKNQWYYFTIIAPKNIDGKTYLLLQSEEDDIFLLPTEFYEHYLLQVGQKIRCLVNDIDPSGVPHLEPEHPTYRLDQLVKLKFASSDILYLSDLSRKHQVYKLLNEKGDVFYLPVRFAPEKINTDEWNTYVIDKFKKGKILVKPLENDPIE